VQVGEALRLPSNPSTLDSPHLHFQLAGGPHVVTATGLPFVIDD
jgi:hypothetical protein